MMENYVSSADLQQWVERIDRNGIPVLEQTVQALDALRADEDDDDDHEVDAQTIAGIVLADPLMTLKVLRFMAERRPQRVLDDVVTVNSAVLLIGVAPFLRHFTQLRSVEALLAEWPAARESVHAVVERGYRAARLALGYAVHRGDVAAEVLHEAALIHDFAEMLVWVNAPRLALRILREHHAHPQMPIAQIEQRVLGIELCDLEQALMGRWHLPDVLTRNTDDRHADAPRVQTVVLANRMARHFASHWQDADLFDDFESLGKLLGITPLVAQRKTYELIGS